MLSEETRQMSDEISVLDLLVVIAESWIAILVVPLLAMGVAYFATRDAGDYTAQAMLPVSVSRVQPVLSETHPDVLVAAADDNITRIMFTASATAEARQVLESAISLLANSSFLSPTDTAAELAAVEVWSKEAALLRQSLERIESGYESSVAVDPVSYASAVTLLMTELTTREHNLRKADIRLNQKVVTNPEAVRVTISATSGATDIRTIAIVGFAAGLLTVLVALLRNALGRLGPDAKGKVERIRRAFFIPTRSDKA